MSPFYKTVPMPDRGVAYQLKPHGIDPRAWFTLSGFRTRQGTIRSLHGWDSIMAPALDEPITGISELFIPETLARLYVVMTVTKAYSYDLDTGITTDITGTAILQGNPWWPWSFCMFGGYLYMVSLFTGRIHKWNGTGDLVRLDTSPTFGSINTLNDYLIGFYERTDDEYFPYDLHWAAEGTDDQWVADATIDSGRFPIGDTMDQAVALHRLGNDLIAYKEKTIVPITFIGGNEIFGRRAAVSGVGLIGPYALVAAGDTHFFMGQEAFYSYGGGNVVDDSFGDAIRDKVFGELNLQFARLTRALFMKANLEMAFFYPSIDNPEAVPSGCDKVVVYNMKDGTWYGPLPVLDYVSAVANLTADDPITDFPDVLVRKRVWRARPTPREGTVFTTKSDVLGTVNGNLHGVGSSYTENGTPVERLAESGDHNLQTDATDWDGNKVFFPLSSVFQVNVVNIDIEATDSPAVEFFIGSRLDLSDDITWQGPFAITGNAAQTIRVPVRSTGRWFRVKFVTEALVEFALLGYQFEFERVGNR